jgi:hypothetical protein
MKDFMRKVYSHHSIKEVALFIGGILTGVALAAQKDEYVFSQKEKDDIFIKRNSEEKKEASKTPLDETNNSSE